MNFEIERTKNKKNKMKKIVAYLVKFGTPAFLGIACLLSVAGLVAFFFGLGSDTYDEERNMNVCYLSKRSKRLMRIRLLEQILQTIHAVTH